MSEYYIKACPRCNFEHGWRDRPLTGGDEEFLCHRCGADVVMKHNAGACGVANGRQGVEATIIPSHMKVSDLQDQISGYYEANVSAYLTLWDNATKEVKFIIGNEATMLSVLEAWDKGGTPEEE